MILETWLGETNFDYNFSAPGAIAPTATAIQINSNDHYILNSIVFSSKVGLHNAGAANAVTGLHVWFPFNVAEKHGATAFLDTGHQNRYTGCYIDCSHTWFVNPSATVWTSGFALVRTPFLTLYACACARAFLCARALVSAGVHVRARGCVFSAVKELSLFVS